MKNATIIEIDTGSYPQIQKFLDLPFKLYASTPQWVPQMATDALHMLNRDSNPFYRDNQAVFFLAERNGQAVGRLAVLENCKYNQFNHERTAFFYLFECEQDGHTAGSLFDAGFAWARGRGLEKMIGPKGFSVLDGVGLLVKGFERRPAFGLPYNLPYYPALVEAAGFERGEELVSGFLDKEKARLPEKVKEVAERLQQRRGLHIMRFKTRADLRRLIPQLKEIYNGSLGGTQGNWPLSDEEVQALAKQLLWFADPALLKIVMKGDQAVGFLFAYPDISAAVQRQRGKLFPLGWIDYLFELRRTKWININGAGMIEGYRGLGGTAVLYNELFKSVSESRYRYADIVQIGVENENMQREMRELGIDFYKMHRIYTRGI